MDNNALVLLFVVVAFALILIAATGFRVVRPFERGLVEFLGRYEKTVESGLRWVMPFVKRLAKVDMREQVVDVPPQEVITKDNVVVTVDAVIYFEATDPVKLKYNVQNFSLAVTKLAQTNLRNVVGDLDLDTALTSRDLINMKLREILDDATDKWGTRVVRVEIQRIEPPADVTEAMHRQMKAERLRRAVVTEAEGEKTSRVLKAEGVKASAIIEAEGQAEAIKRVADAERLSPGDGGGGRSRSDRTGLRGNPHRQPNSRSGRNQVLRGFAGCCQRSGNQDLPAPGFDCSNGCIGRRRRALPRPVLGQRTIPRSVVSTSNGSTGG